MAPTQHFGNLHVAFAHLLLVGPRETVGSKAAPVVHHGQYLLPMQLHANKQVENADYQHGQEEEGQRGNQDDQLVHPGGLDQS